MIGYLVLCQELHEILLARLLEDSQVAPVYDLHSKFPCLRD